MIPREVGVSFNPIWLWLVTNSTSLRSETVPQHFCKVVSLFPAARDHAHVLQFGKCLGKESPLGVRSAAILQGR